MQWIPIIQTSFVCYCYKLYRILSSPLLLPYSINFLQSKIFMDRTKFHRKNIHECYPVHEIRQKFAPWKIRAIQ